MSLSSHQSARMKNDEWLTPKWIIDPLGEFDLDPCAPIIRPWPTAKFHYSKINDGIKQPWHGRVWLNPPFGDQAGEWLSKLMEHGNGIALVAARTETEWFYESVWGKADGILFIKSRPNFHYVDGSRAKFNSGAPIVLIAYGEDNCKSLISSGLGFFTRAK
jgi:hypothetical protein